MVFTQQVHFQRNNTVDREFEKICKEHPSCENCPLQDEDVNIQDIVITCITGRMKGSN